MASVTATRYRKLLRVLSDRLVEAQQPIRILDAIKWDETVQRKFFEAGCREQPVVDRGYYEARPLPFDPRAKREEFQTLERDINQQLGQFSPIGAVMRRICREYQTVVHMLEARGTNEFSLLSRELYGSAGDVFHAGDPTLTDLARMLSDALSHIDSSIALPADVADISAADAVSMLQKRLDNVFHGADANVRVILDDGIVADAAAGSDYIKIRRDARFSERDIRLLEVHEGWVHVATTLNGLAQPVCTFLGKGPPSATVTQEGLAMLIEVMAFSSHPARVRRVTNRIRAIEMAEAEATFVDVFDFFRNEGLSEGDSYANTTRVFRGSLPTAGPFTKDIAYAKGFVLIYSFVQLAVRRGLLDRIPLLFCGKTTLEDMRTLAQLADEGLVVAPRYLPPMVADLAALTAWMCYSNFLNHLSLDRIAADYANML
jgi:uncharacterized protein (TIGR02421 family)